jgi:hypothetical protein
MTGEPDFWKASGYGLLEHGATGERLRVTDDFLRAYFVRPEMLPPEDACANERRLHASLLDQPGRPVTETELAALADPDAVDNYRVILNFRDQLLTCRDIESAYLQLIQRTNIGTPPLFLDHLAHVILRNVLEGCGAPLQARAAELFFRSQRITLRDGQILAADEETIETFAETRGYGSLGRLLVESETPAREIELDVLDESNADVYWSRSERFDTVLDLTFGRPGLDALCRVMERWVRHFLDIEVRIHPVQSIRDERWRWHCGLDSVSSAILNDLYSGEEVEEERLARLISLFRLQVRESAAVIPEMAGRPVYLGLAMNEASTLRMKPQNLLVNLPLLAAS